MLTHFHSDHIAEIYEVNLNSWVQGRPEPLMIYGPQGVDEVVDGINTSYRQDQIYRTEHHGDALLPPTRGVIEHQVIRAGEVLADGHLTITAYVAEHPPIHLAVGFRFDYRGRSVVISGDSNVTAETAKISNGADLLLHDALSVPVVSTLSKAASEAGLSRVSKIMSDVLDYHASTDSLIELVADVDMVAFYPLVPSPLNFVIKDIFERDLPDHYLLVEDGMWFELPLEGDENRSHWSMNAGNLPGFH